jgi:hypothetical protein
MPGNTSDFYRNNMVNLLRIEKKPRRIGKNEKN